MSRGGRYAKQHASAAFAPTDIAGLRLWLDPTDAATITQSSTRVSQINDKSGNGFHFVQATGSKQPFTTTRTINLLNTLDFEVSVQCFMTATGAATPQTVMGNSAAGSAFYVVALDADPPSDAASGATLGSWGADTGSPFDAEPWSDGTVYHGWGSTVRKITGNPTPALTTPRLIEIKTASGAWSYVIDAATHYTTATNTVGWRNASNAGGTAAARLGFSSDSAYWFDGRMGEVVIYDTALSGANLTAIRSYLKTKWGTA